jgi:hypothetical protein
VVRDLGFVAASQILTVMFEGRPLGLYLLNVGYQLIACGLAGVILAAWQRRPIADRERLAASPLTGLST